MEDNIAQYRQLVKDLIQEYAQYKPSVGDIETEVVFDDANDHYELIHTGWNRTHRVHGAVLHIDIRDGKVVIQHDGTPDAVAEILAERGIPRDRIVLAFKPPEIRPHTGFAAS
ncbi:MAG TPA: XisI protein [Chthonomonadaceae bacterium]|nr:XisI protein [Chthonomonadaceae bacterium]